MGTSESCQMPTQWAHGFSYLHCAGGGGLPLAKEEGLFHLHVYLNPTVDISPSGPESPIQGK
jgi:hypothetical protein